MEGSTVRSGKAAEELIGGLLLRLRKIANPVDWVDGSAVLPWKGVVVELSLVLL